MRKRKKKSQGKRKTTIKEVSEVQKMKKDMALMKADIKDARTILNRY